MRQHTAYLMLLARSSFYKIIALLAAMAAVETGLFLRCFHHTETGVGAELFIDHSHIVWVLAVALVAMTVFLCLPGCEFGSKSSYTLRRLGLSDHARYFWQAGYNTLCFLLLWAVQVALCWGMCVYYTTHFPAVAVTNQTIYLAFYRSNLLHSLLPLSDVSRWIRNALLVPALGFAAAHFPRTQQQKGRPGITILALVVVTLITFVRPMGEWDWELIVIAAAALIFSIVLPFRKEAET